MDSAGCGEAVEVRRGVGNAKAPLRLASNAFAGGRPPKAPIYFSKGRKLPCLGGMRPQAKKTRGRQPPNQAPVAAA
jgi:hypothetical protein